MPSIFGKVEYGDGSKAPHAAVSACVRGGGVTSTVYTDDNGQYSLSWSGGSELASVYVNHKEVAAGVWAGNFNISL